MYHCKCCDQLFEPRKNKFTGDDELLCEDCLVIARYSAYDIDDVNSEDISLSLDMLDIDLD